MEEKEVKVEEAKEEAKEVKETKTDSKKKSKAPIFIIGVIAIAAIIAIVAVLLLRDKKIIISFDSDGGKFVSAIEVSKGKSIKLPETEKEGFILDGWYLNDTRVTNSTKLDEDVTLKARWISEEAKTFTVTFDSDGGSKVDNIIVECGKELSLPANPTKKGYTFLSWIDKNGTPIYDRALLSCEDIALEANWKKNETETKPTNQNTTEPEKEKKYTCPKGYNLDGTKCISETEKVKVTESCETGYSYSQSQGICYISVSPTRVCQKYKDYDGIIIQDSGHYYCAYYEFTTYNGSERSCEHVGYQYMNGKCYVKIIENNYTLECESGYKYYTGRYFSSSQTLPVCAVTKVTIRTCPSGYTQDGNYCYKTIDATLE